MRKLALLLMLGVGCQAADDPKPPKPLTGRIYVLESIGGEHLPTTISTANSQNPLHVAADTLALHDDGTAERRLVHEGDSNLRGTPPIVDVETTLRWTRSGEAVTIRWEDCPGLDCLPTQVSGTESNGRLTITTSDFMRVPLVYRYLYPPD